MSLSTTLPDDDDMSVKKKIVPVERIERSILLIRGHKVILDADLAALYRVETRVLIQAVKRNSRRFPPDFLFQLSAKEAEFLRSQIVISKNRAWRTAILALYFH